MARWFPRLVAALLLGLGLADSSLAAPPPVQQPAAAPPAAVAPAPSASMAAPEITPAAASALAEKINTGLLRWFPPSSEGSAYRWDGTTTVVTEGDHYLATLPALTVTNEDGSKLAVGVVTIALKPTSNGNFGVDLRLPARIPMLNAEGKPDGELTIGTQRLTGTWVPSLETFVKADIALGEVRAVGTKDASSLQIGQISINTDLTETGSGRWSGPSNFTLQNLVVTDESGKPAARVGSVAIEAAITGIDLAHAAHLNDQLEHGAPNPTPSAVKKRLALVHGLFSGATGQIKIQDFLINTPAESGRFGFHDAAIQIGIEGLDRAGSTLSLGYDHGGLIVEPAVGPPEFMPERITFKIAATNLPNAGLWSALEHLFDSGEEPHQGNAPDNAEEQIGADLLANLTQAGAEIRIETLNLETPATSGKLAGSARFNINSMLGLEANFEMVLRGLDAAIRKLQPAPGKPGDEETQSILAGLGMLQAMGQQGKDAAGQEIRSYKIVAGPDGRITLNGADLTAMLMPGGPAKAKPPTR